MAQIILSSVGQAVGGPVGAVIGSTLGRAIDQRAIASLEPARQKGPRLEALKVQGGAEGAPMAAVFGRARVTGQVIWAARFLEGRKTSSGGKGGPRTVEYDYSLSFAVALCEGEIDGIGRIWADGRPMDLSGVTMRVHRGGGDQTPDPLIEAVEGVASAFRGTAYVVFEDLPLGPYGNRPPQLSFEVFRRATADGTALEDRLEGVCLIPGAGEFVLATDPVTRREGLTRTRPENVHGGGGRTDLIVSLDQLMAQAPESRPDIAVLGGANALAVETAGGWELVQFRTAELIGQDVWRLGGLLRGQQGTEAATAAGAQAGAVVVVMDAAPVRAESPLAERGAPLIWRAGPAGGPAGGAAVSEVAYAATGVHDRPWSPAHLRADARADGGFDLGWIARSRIDGDRWDGEPAPADPMRFRIRILAGPSEVRTFEAEGVTASYAAADVAADFPGGAGPAAVVAVAQWGDGYGWGVEATAALG